MVSVAVRSGEVRRIFERAGEGVRRRYSVCEHFWQKRDAAVSRRG